VVLAVNIVIIQILSKRPCVWVRGIALFSRSPRMQLFDGFCHVVRRFAILLKETISFVICLPVRPSVRMEQLGSH
jgi:hypothetical protein